MPDEPPPLRSADRAPRAELFRLLVEQVRDYAIFGLDDRGIVVSWNSGAERIKGYRADEIIGHHFSRFYPEEAIRAGWPQTELGRATEDGRFEDEGWRVRKDGTRFWAHVVITALRDEDGTLRGFAKVTRDLTEEKRAAQLETDVRVVGEFVAMLGHELRNPLAPIRNAIDVAKRADDPQRTRWALEVVERQSAHLTRLVDDLLDIGRITRGQLSLSRRRVPLRYAIESAVEATRANIERHRHQLTVTYRAHPRVRGDSVRLTQVFANLLDNACKYTPDGGHIDVEVSAEEDTARVVVSDTGVGVSPERLPHLFDVFTQERRSLARSEGGLGLGLAVARHLVELHGGDIVAESPGPGCGSTFRVTLPLLELLADDTEGLRPSVLSALVIDDNRDAAEMLAALLEAHGHETSLAFDGREGVRLAAREQPDVILLDIGLPDMDGYQVARRLRSDPALRGVVLVAVTGYGAEEDRRRALESGFDVHLSKPIDYATLQRRVPIFASP